MYFNRLGRPFVGKKIASIIPYLPKGTDILDIGSGNGLVSGMLREKGYHTVPIDIHEGHYHPDVKPIIYDGKQLPFPDNHFSCGIVLTVLHHVEQPDTLLKEIMRVCQSAVIMEDIYENGLQKRITFLLDSIANVGYSPCPHTNKNDSGWRNTFDTMHLKLRDVHYRKIALVAKQAIYVVEKKNHQSV